MAVLKERVLNSGGHNLTSRKAISRLSYRSIGEYALGGLLLCLGSVPAIFAQGPAEDYQVKAAFLFHFAQLVEWPPEAGTADDSSVTLCVFENQPQRQEILSAIDGKPIGSRTFRIRGLRPGQDARGCRLLFFPNDCAKSQAATLNSLRGLPILTVGEGDEFLPDGGIIRLRIAGDQIHFDINLDASELAGLRISSRLLLLAAHVQRTSADARGGR